MDSTRVGLGTLWLEPLQRLLARPRLAGVVAALLLLNGAVAAAETLPSVARPRFQIGAGSGEEWRGRGTAFFLENRAQPGAIAVAPAHNFILSELTQAFEVSFVLGASGERVSASSRFHAAPGRAFDAPGATMADDFMLFALDMRPRGVRVLRPAQPEGEALEGQRVRVLGVPSQTPHDEDDVWGTVASADTLYIEVRLDVVVDLRGWGGAPVLRHPEGDVIGIVQAARSTDSGQMLRLTPIAPIVAAANRPLEGGLGRSFKDYHEIAIAGASTAGRPPHGQAREPSGGQAGEPSGATSDSTARGWTPPPAPSRPRDPDSGNSPGAWTPPPAPTPSARPGESAPTWTPPPGGSGEWDQAARESDGSPAPAPPGPATGSANPSPAAAAAVPIPTAAAPFPTPAAGDTLLGQAGATKTELRVEIEQPVSGVVTGDVTGAFVAGRALAAIGGFRKFDVMLVLDTSSSTSAMSGADINANGVVGEGRLGNLMGGVFGGTDSGDSILSAEVAAARRILQSLDARNTRVGLVSFAGTPPAEPGFILGSPRRPDAIVEEPLTDDFSRVEAALEHILRRGPQGNTNMAEAVDRGYIELFGLGGAISEPDRESEKVILFFTDGQPTGPFDPSLHAANVEAVLRAAQRSDKLGVTIHSFAIGPDALAGPVAVVEMARRTGGYFTPVRNPGDLVAVIDNVNLTQVADVIIENLSTQSAASELEHKADGSFSALVPLQVGNNRIRVRARAMDGAEASAEVSVQYAPGEPGIELPREFMAARNELLERRLLALRRERLGVEREVVDQARKELQFDIERERAEAEARADEQRKRLDLEPVEEGATSERTTPDAPLL